MHRGIFYFLFFLHMGSTVLYNAMSSLAGYIHIHEQAGCPGLLTTVKSAIQRVVKLPPLAATARYAGTDTGYGFFAPQISSSLQLEVTVYGRQDERLATIHGPMFRTNHSQLRYSGLLNRLQHLLPDHGGSNHVGSLQQRQAKAIAHCLSQRLAQQHTTSGLRIRCQVYAYQHTTLANHQQGAGGYRVPLYQHDMDHPSTTHDQLTTHEPLFLQPSHPPHLVAALSVWHRFASFAFHGLSLAGLPLAIWG